MPKTKLTEIEINSLIVFGKRLDDRMQDQRLGFAELSRLTHGAVSPGYISDIVRAGRGDSDKYFRLGRDKVTKLAAAVGWDIQDALNSAGFRAANEEIASPNEDLDLVLLRLREQLTGVPANRRADVMALVEALSKRWKQGESEPAESDVEIISEE